MTKKENPRTAMRWPWPLNRNGYPNASNKYSVCANEKLVA